MVVGLRARVGAVLIAALAAGVLTSCGGGEPLSIAEFQQRANDECSALENASNAFRKAQNPTASGSDVRGFVHRAAERLRELVSNLDELEPPDSLEAESQELLDVLSEYADGLDELADDVRDDQSFQAALAENPDAVAHLNELATRAGELVSGDLGFVSCVLPG